MTIKKNRNRFATNFLKNIIVVFILMASFSVSSQTQTKKGNIKVVVNNLKSKTGHVAFFLFNSGDGFPSHTEKALLSGYVKTAGNTVEYTFTNVASGTYAVYVFHDSDSDKKLNTNFIGMPKEGMGVSNNAKGHFGPPKYDDAKFVFNKPEQTIVISLTYL